MMTPTVHFFQRTFPSANIIVLSGKRPILVDTGFGSDISDTLTLLQQIDLMPQDLQMAVNTHYHCDHVGGNHVLQQQYNLPIAGHHWDVAMINNRDIEACAAEWLDQPIESYTINLALADGDVLNTGDAEFQVIHTPGHTLGHICLYADGVLIAGDTFHADDVAWLNPFREGAGTIYRILETLEKLAQLPLTQVYSGHGAANHKPMTTLQQAQTRYEKWITQPEKVAWHACKRIFAYALMLFDGLTQSQFEAYLLDRSWYLDYCRHIFHADPSEFMKPFLDEMLRSKAAEWQGVKLMPTAPYNLPDPEWLSRIQKPRNWK
jgi:glyoxylase-like metal-dependent hydrolase (beta-lactamase superfamily II)